MTKLWKALGSPLRLSRRLPRILSDTITIGFFASAVKVAGAAKVILTARFFGAGDALDAYLIAFLLPSFAADMFAGCFTPSLVPVLVSLRATGRQVDALRLSQTGLAAAVLVMSALGLALACCGGWLLPGLGSSFDAQKLRLTGGIFLVLLIWLPVAACVATWRAVLNADRSFGVAAAAPIATPLMTMAALWWFAPRWGVYALCIGTVAGTLLELTVLACAVRSRGGRLAPAWDGWTPELAGVARRFTPLAAGVLLSSAWPVVDQAFAGMLGSGAVSALVYGSKFAGVLMAISAGALSTAALPVFARLAADADWPGLRLTATRYAVSAFAVSLPVTAVLMMWSGPLVRFFLQQGAFRPSATIVVAQVQNFALLEIPVAILLALAIRVAVAVSANALLARVAIAGFFFNLACNWAFSRRMGVSGIALATVVAQGLSLVLLIVLLARKERKLPRSPGPGSTLASVVLHSG